MKSISTADDIHPPSVCRCHLDLLPLAEVAARLGVSVPTVKRWRRAAGLPSIQINHASFCFWSDVEAWARDRAASQKTS